MVNILLSCVGRRSYLVSYFKEALNGSGKVFATNSVMTNALLQADEYAITPLVHNKEYENFLIQFCVDHKINVIISLFDIDVAFLSKRKPFFEENGIIILTPDYDVVKKCYDKWLMFNFLTELNIDAPLSFIDLSEVHIALAKGTLNFPLILKPRWGMGSIGLYEVNNISELIVLYDKLKTDIFSTYLGHDSLEDKEHCIIIQQKIVGKEYGIQILNDLNKEYVATMAIEKIAMRSGETDLAVTIESQPFEYVAKMISHNLHHILLLDTDCIIDNCGHIFILDMNCRFGGQYPFSHLAGANMPKQIIEWINGNATNPSLCTVEYGILSNKDIMPRVISN